MLSLMGDALLELSPAQRRGLSGAQSFLVAACDALEVEAWDVAKENALIAAGQAIDVLGSVSDTTALAPASTRALATRARRLDRLMEQAAPSWRMRTQGIIASAEPQATMMAVEVAVAIVHECAALFDAERDADTRCDQHQLPSTDRRKSFTHR